MLRVLCSVAVERVGGLIVCCVRQVGCRDGDREDKTAVGYNRGEPKVQYPQRSGPWVGTYTRATCMQQDFACRRKSSTSSSRDPKGKTGLSTMPCSMQVYVLSLLPVSIIPFLSLPEARTFQLDHQHILFKKCIPHTMPATLITETCVCWGGAGGVRGRDGGGSTLWSMEWGSGAEHFQIRYSLCPGSK